MSMESLTNTGTNITLGDGTVIHLRRLSVADVFAVAKLIAKFFGGGLVVSTEEVKEGLFDAVLGMEEDVINFLSSLVGKSYDEFMALPPEALFAVVDGLMEGEDLIRFLEQVKKVVSKIMAKFPESVRTQMPTL